MFQTYLKECERKEAILLETLRAEQFELQSAIEFHEENLRNTTDEDDKAAYTMKIIDLGIELRKVCQKVGELEKNLEEYEELN